MVEQQLPFVERDEPVDWRETDSLIGAAEQAGDVGEAKRIAASAVQAAREAKSGDDGSMYRLPFCLESRANLFNRQGDFGAAKEDYLEAISCVEGQPDEGDTLGRLYGNLGFLLETIGEEDEAVGSYEVALDYLVQLKERQVMDEIRLANNLAFIFSARDDFDQAETLFLKALKVAHDKLGPTDPDTTGIFNNIGALYQKAGHFEQAREMHSMALEGRKDDGRSPSDVAQSHGNLAIVLAEEGDEQGAREHFESALKAFQRAGIDWLEDFEAVCENYLQLLHNVGDDVGEERVRQVLSKGI